MKAILDAGPLIAAWKKDDEHHGWARRIFQAYHGPFYTSEAVLMEVAHLSERDDLVIEGLPAVWVFCSAQFSADGRGRNPARTVTHCDQLERQ